MSDLPPLDQPQAYVVVGPNDQRGPYTMELLISEVVAGRLSEETPVWWPGLADWTTLGGHPAVAAELASRRAPSGAAPAWAEPAAADPYAAPTADPYAAPTADPYAAPTADPYAAPTADPFASPATDPFSVSAQEQGAEPIGDPFAPQSMAQTDTEVVSAERFSDHFAQEGETAGADQPGVGSEQSFAASYAAPDDEPVDAEVIEVEEIIVVDDVHGEVFAALVARSSVRAQVQGRIDAVNEAVIAGIVAGVESQGAALAERVDTDRGAELRFDGADGDLVVVSLGRASAARPDDLREDHVPVTASYRSGARKAEPDQGGGSHGDVVVSADEWTGQSTSSVSLFLPLGDYLDESLEIDSASLARDAAATVAVLRSRLG